MPVGRKKGQHMEHILEVHDLCVDYHTKQGTIRPVSHVSFSVSRGETLGIVGESGCGKSTASLAVMRLLPQNRAEIAEGEILFDGKDLARMPEKELRQLRGDRLSMIFQEPMTSLNPVFTIGDQLSQPLRRHTSLGREEIRRQMVEILGQAGIPRPEAILGEYPHQLSGGMRQRVMICMAIVCRPELLIADEPTTALDVTIQAQILDLLKKIRDKNRMAMIFITHDLGVVAEICDRVMVMYAGQAVEQADIRPFFDRPAHPYSQGLLAAMPREDERKQELSTIPGSVPALNELPSGCYFCNRCPRAADRCRTEPAPMVCLPDGRLCRCWLYADKGEVIPDGR